MIHREHYIAQIRPFYESDLIKVITGIRRSGKSVILEQIRDELLAEDKQVIFLNFEDRAVAAEIMDDMALIRYIETARKPGKCYVLLDEVQNLKDWNLACRTLRLHDISLFITGSNSRLLSREFTRELSGRYVAFCVRPFVFKELEAYASALGREVSVGDYLLYGGFPKRLEFSDAKVMLRYLNNLDETIVLNDIMNRYHIRKEQIFRRLVDYVLISNARIFSANAIYNYLKSQRMDCSINTVIKYIGYLEEAYVIRKMPQFSVRARRKLDFYAKIYNEDVALNTIRQPQGQYDITHNMENIIYNELIYMGYTLSVYTHQDKEIDFLAAKDGREYLIQAAYSIAEKSTYDREFRLLNLLDNSRQKLIITNDEADYSTSTVKHIKLRDFLQMEDLQRN